MKVAIVHDWLVSLGGGERVVEALHELFPDAPVYTTIYDKKRLPESFEKIEVIPSFLQHVPFARKKHQGFLPLMPMAFESFDLSDYDLVISSSSSCAKGVITGANTVHICYCHTPMRYAWDFYHGYTKHFKGIKKLMVSSLMKNIRIWDRLSADRVDYFIANSNNVANRIRKHYKRESTVIYPPVDVEKYMPDNVQKNYYLIVSRLIPYKRVDLAIEAFNELGLPLKIIGSGTELKKLKQMSKPNIEFLGILKDEEVKAYYANCKAFIFPGEEDFGITPLEAQACGIPVIAYGKGGALETVIDGITGLLFLEQTRDALMQKVKLVENGCNFDKETIRNHALGFSKQEFQKKILAFIERVTEKH